tara:strand:+ start:183 stop:404 length:222 start_codon:yes stop_codon:yes gene_type:complete
MKTNYAKDLFLLFDNFNISEKTKGNKNSLLKRNSGFSSMNNDIKSQPVFKVARYKNTIKKKRMEFLNARNSTT